MKHGNMKFCIVCIAAAAFMTDLGKVWRGLVL